MTTNDLQPDSDVDIASGDLSRAEEYMSTISTWTGDLHGVGTAVCLCGDEGHSTALVAVGREDRPCCLIPSALKIVGDLSDGEGKERERGEASFAQHDRRRSVVLSQTRRRLLREQTSAFIG